MKKLLVLSLLTMFSLQSFGAEEEGWVDEFKDLDTSLFENTECSICLEEIKENYFAADCKHSFHKECIKRWILTVEQENNDKCPICRNHASRHTINNLSDNVIFNVWNRLGLLS